MLAEVERDILALVWRFRRRTLPTEKLADAVAHVCPEHQDTLATALHSLRARGILEGDDGGWTIALSAADLALRVKREQASAGFDETFAKMDGSPAAQRYNRLTYGWDVFSFNMVEAEQRAALLGACCLGPEHRFLDLGCATGAITSWLAVQTGAAGLGVDIAASAIQRAAGLPGRVEFAVQDMDLLALEPASFDVVVAVDTLYFADDLQQTIADLWAALVPGGRLVTFYTVQAGEGEVPSLANSALGRALPTDARVETVDVTALGHKVWRDGRAALDALKSAFADEGLASLWQGRDGENRAMLAKYEAGRCLRLLVTAHKPV